MFVVLSFVCICKYVNQIRNDILCLFDFFVEIISYLKKSEKIISLSYTPTVGIVYQD